MLPREPYRPRAVRFLGLWSPSPAPTVPVESGSPQPWRIKVYSIAYRGECASDALVAAAKRAALDAIAGASDSYRVGFLGIHEGRGADFVFVDWWSNENELHHRVFIGPSGRPDELRLAGAEQPIACVWDLAVIGFERQAWVDTVLDNSNGPDIEEYLARRLNATL